MGGEVLNEVCEGLATRDDGVARLQYDAVEMKEVLINFCFQYLLRPSTASAVHRMFAFYPTIDMRETTVE